MLIFPARQRLRQRPSVTCSQTSRYGIDPYLSWSIISLFVRRTVSGFFILLEDDFNVSNLFHDEKATFQSLILQGGNFDLADRMFHSVKDGWLSAAKNNMADVKELIPEFFYLPDFLVNSNKFDLGTKQSGVQLDDVVLPAWAKGDAREFIRIHREALECDFVSSHLNEWIDLVFGCKQQG